MHAFYVFNAFNCQKTIYRFRCLLVNFGFRGLRYNQITVFYFYLLNAVLGVHVLAHPC